MSKAAFLLRYGNAKHISDSLEDTENDINTNDIKESISKNPYWNSSHTQQIINQDWHNAIHHAISHPTTTSEQLSHAIENGDFRSTRSAILHPSATEEHRLKAIHHNKTDAVRSLLNADNTISRNVYQKISEHPNADMRRIAAKSFRTPDDLIEKLSNDPDKRVSDSAISTRNLNRELDGFK